MHMSDALLSPAVGVTMCAVSAAAGAFCLKKIQKDDLCEKKIPVMGVMSAFIFCAQMINFTIPATGSSGHIGGGVLLAALLGGLPALLSISAVLIIQCLFFADGGLLALGCNIFNLGVIPCLFVYPLVFKPLVKKNRSFGMITAAAVAAAVIGLQLGALSVVLQTRLSGITELPFFTFLLLMQPVHLAIGLFEGIVTASVLCFVYKARPRIMDSVLERTAVDAPLRGILIVFAALTIFAGGVLSLYASPYPDGLEWAVEKTAGTADLPIKGALPERAAAVQEAVAFMPDYGFSDGSGTGVAGVLGGAIVCLLAGGAALAVSSVKKRQKVKSAV